MRGIAIPALPLYFGKMAHTTIISKRGVGWMGLKRGHKARPLEWLAEQFIFLVSLSAIVMVFLIFLFVAREALPILLGQMNSASVQKVIPVENMDKLTPAQLQSYLGLTSQQFAEMDQDTKKTLMELKIDSAKEASTDKDAAVNTTSWRYMLHPYQWTGYDRPSYIWQPVSQIEKYNIVPLLIGSLKATLVALLFSVPLALGAAIYVSQLSKPRT